MEEAGSYESLWPPMKLRYMVPQLRDAQSEFTVLRNGRIKKIIFRLFCVDVRRDLLLERLNIRHEYLKATCSGNRKV